jgi:hypothetical protein
MRPADTDTEKLLRGDLRLLHDLAVLGCVLDDERVPARTRLERELGPELVRVVHASLAQPPGRLAA